MKKLLLITLLFLSTNVYSQPQKKHNAPETKNEISILGGQALNMMTDWSLVGQPFFINYFTGINYYRNFDQWQIGIGFNTEISSSNPATKYVTTFKTPHLIANRTLELKHIGFYAGVMVGYTSNNHEDTYDFFGSSTHVKSTGNGVVGGIQGGVLFKIHRIFAINLEVAARARETKYKSVQTTTGNFYGQPPGQTRVSTTEYGQSAFYLPLRIGFRFRF